MLHISKFLNVNILLLTLTPSSAFGRIAKKMDIKMVWVTISISNHNHLFGFMFEMVIVMFFWYLQGVFLNGPMLHCKSRHVRDKFSHVWDCFSLVCYLLTKGT